MTSSSAARIEPLYVVDTHALIWYLTGDIKLSARALSILRAAEHGNTQLILPAIVLAEMYYANAKNKWFESYRAVYTALLETAYFTTVPLDAYQILEFERDAVIPEMHDRIIAGVARRLSAPLITADPLIIASGVVVTDW